ncbi:hypothetical protein A4X09_0g7844 [Tilletia walkeri]|uniref:RNase III domain-containing protein n=1 Tax=Tilletia walkeri TaxID=117179 RepID=A0A8X7T187_9BASI|nr:hypothetical protein A4X09_0g7844 [Tilletia walkeri]
MPTVLDRIHQSLCAQRCNEEIFKGKVAISHLIEALTPRLALQEHNYDRLEFLGDAFLKLLGRAFVFADGIEGPYHQSCDAFSRIIVNESLQRRCMDHKLHDFMMLQSFSYGAWVPPNFVNPKGGRATTELVNGRRGEGYLPSPKAYHTKFPISPKTRADLVEAAMGAGVMTNGIDGALHVARCLNITPYPIHSLGDTADMYHQKTSETIREKKLDTKIDSQVLKKLKGFLGYTFRSPHIALRVTHPSANFEGMLLSVKVSSTIRAA